MSKKEYYEKLEPSDWENLAWYFYEKEYQKRGLTPKRRHIERLRGQGFTIWCRLTNRRPNFASLLNWTLPNRLLKEEFTKKDFLLSKIEKDDSCLGGFLTVPFNFKSVVGTIEFKHSASMKD